MLCTFSSNIIIIKYSHHCLCSAAYVSKNEIYTLCWLIVAHIVNTLCGSYCEYTLQSDYLEARKYHTCSSRYTVCSMNNSSNRKLVVEHLGNSGIVERSLITTNIYANKPDPIPESSKLCVKWHYCNNCLIVISIVFK